MMHEYHEYRKFKWRALFRALHCVAKNEVSGLQALSKWMQMAFVGCYLRFTGILFNSIKAAVRRQGKLCD
jgi:hypothetical protein